MRRKDGYITLNWDFGGTPIESLDKDQLSEKYSQCYSDASKRTASEEVNQVYRFTHEMQEGETVIMPDPMNQIYYIGEITGPYRFIDADQNHPEGSYRRSITWHTDVPFDAPLSETLRRALDIANLTVYMVVDTVLNELTRASQNEEDASQDENDALQDGSASDGGVTKTNPDEAAEEIDVENSEQGGE